MMEQILNWLVSLIELNTTCDTGRPINGLMYIERALNSVCKIEVGDARSEMSASFCKSPVAIGILDSIPAPILIAKLDGKRKESILLHAHIDTAPYEPDGAWRVPPEKATRLKGNIFGRGSLDCKSQTAVWMKLFAEQCVKLTEGTVPEKSLMLLITSDEETGGHQGLEVLLKEKPELLRDVSLVLGEGGGFSFPCGEKLYYTFQTGEQEWSTADDTTVLTEKAIIDRIHALSAAGYCDEEKLLSYRSQAGKETKRLDLDELLHGANEFLQNTPKSAVSSVYADYGVTFESALRTQLPNAELMPVITPGFSDNRHFRHHGIPTIGFFPFDAANHILMHQPNEYVSEKTLALSYRIMGDIVNQLCNS